MLRQMPTQLREEAAIQRDLLSDYDGEDREEVPQLLEQAADAVEELLRLREYCLKNNIALPKEL